MEQETFQDAARTILAGKPNLKDLNDRLSKMIDYGIKRQDWYEDQRNKALTLGIALLGLSSFLVSGLLSTEVKHMPYFRVFAALTLIAVVLTALSIILEYALGASAKYTHRDLADIRSWYFAYVIKDDVASAAIHDEKFERQNKTILMTAWKEFVRGWLEYQKTDTARVAEDLQQVFVLYLFQSMRRNSLRKMVGRAQTGGLVIAILLLPTIVTAALRW